LFKYDPQRPVTNRRGGLPAGVDVRGDGGYIIFPPSKLPDGRAWRVQETCETDAITDAPELYELIAEKPATGAGSRGAKGDSSAYGEAALNGEIAKVSSARQGARNVTLNNAALKLGHLVGARALSAADVEDRLYGAAIENGLVADHGERAARMTIKSGLEAGMGQPRDIPERGHRYRAPGPPPGDDDSAHIPPRVIRPTIFFGREPPKRRWIVPEWIPYGAVTGLYGKDGLGKSILAMQLQTAAALGDRWLNVPVDPVISLGVYCEDDEHELWRRQWAINADYGCDLDQRLGAIHWMSRLGEDNILMTFSSKGVGELTDFYREVVTAALDFKAKLVAVDAATDTFGGADENNRGQVRQYVQRALGGIALKIGGAVLCNAHPSRSGIKSKEGDSGSTGWSAAFRSRLYFYEPDHEENEPRDYDARILERMKANYASRGDQLRVRYHHGVFIPDGVTAPSIRTTAGLIEAKTVFLRLVSELDAQKRPVSSKSRASNYAPRQFAKLPTDQRNGLQEADFEKAMNVLFRDKAIENLPYGRKGDERTKIVVREQTTKPEGEE
jgi:RecA-family ATPase